MASLVVPRGVSFVFHRLAAAGKEAFLVGGCVRDMLMGIPPRDYDMCSSARPEELIELFSSCSLVTAGVKHGTVGVLTDTGLVEITTYRREGVYPDHRHPESVAFVSDLKEDLSRRDFTMNAMAMSATGEITDLFGGQEDIQRKTLRCVGKAEIRFEEDALRILRALRFASRFGFSLDSETAAAVHSCGHRLANIAAERCWDELKGVLQGDGAVPAVNEFLDVIQVILPGARFLRENLPADLSLRLACLVPESGEEYLRKLRCEKSRMRDIREIQTLPCPHNKTELWKMVANYGKNRTGQILQYNGLPVDGLEEVLRQSPCREAAQLAVTGADLQEIHITGRQIGVVLDNLLAAVLECRVPNEQSALLSFAKSIAEK